MEITYLNMGNASDLEKSKIDIEGRGLFLLPRIAFSYVKALEAEIELTQSLFDKGVKSIEKQITKVIDQEDIDEAVNVFVLYEGESFYNSIHCKQNLVYGRYGIKAEFADKSCKIAYLDAAMENVIFIDPKQHLDKLNLAEV